jgi:DNA gyrase subunit B/topoisomerase-4 subunit B
MKFTTPKLVDCAQHGLGCELFIVEGDSAARSLVRARDPENQAVLPMQGKPMNALKANASDLHDNVQFGALLDTLHVDLHQIARPVEIPYQRIVLLFDPDADGIHGRTLMLLFFYRWLRKTLDDGRIFDAHAPQWVVTSDKMTNALFASTPQHLKKIKEHLKDKGITGVKTKRFRGLGSVDLDILNTQCVDPKTRALTVLTAAHAENALTVFEDFRSLGRN